MLRDWREFHDIAFDQAVVWVRDEVCLFVREVLAEMRVPGAGAVLDFDGAGHEAGGCDGADSGAVKGGEVHGL